jgi:hypothetical protein
MNADMPGIPKSATRQPPCVTCQTFKGQINGVQKAQPCRVLLLMQISLVSPADKVIRMTMKEAHFRGNQLD